MICARFLAALAVAGAVAGFWGSSAAQAPAAPPAAPAAAAPADADPVVAVVNGEAIRASDIVYLYQTLGEGVRQMAFELLYPQLLTSAIERKAAAQKARGEKVQERADVKKRFEFWNDRVLEETLLNETVEKALTNDVLQKAYRDRVAQESGREEVKVKHMLFQNPEAAISVIKELDNGGNFDQVLALLTAQGVARGGELDFFKQDELVPQFADAAFRMRPGEYNTTPVRSEFGFHVILVTDRRVSPPPKFEDVQAELRQTLGAELVEKFYVDLLAGAQVQRFNFDGTPTNQ